MIATFLLVAFSAAFVPVLMWFAWYKFSKTCRMLNKIPGPKPTPFFGNITEAYGSLDHVFRVVHTEWPSVFGEIYRFYITPNYSVMVSSPELVEEIVNKPNLLDKSADYSLLDPWLGHGLLTSTGSKWKSRRRLLTPAFHFHIMEDFFETFNQQSDILCSKIEKLCADTGKAEIDIQELTGLCTLDIICETAMGCKVNAQTEDSEYVRAVHRISSLLIQRSLSPLGRIDAFYALTSQGKEYDKCLKILLAFTEEVISAN